MLLVGLTGGIGSGKSTVADGLARRGFVVVDADAIARGLLAPGGAALREVLAEFGSDLVDGSGALDRQRLAAIVFADPARRARLEALTHPHVAAGIDAAIVEARQHHGEDVVVVIDHPLLVETGQADRFAAVVVVRADEAVRLARLARERGMTTDEVRARMGAQVDDAARLAVATHVIDNDGSLEDLERAVDVLAADLRDRAAA